MRAARLSMLAIPLMMGVAFAQTAGSQNDKPATPQNDKQDKQSDKQMSGSQSGAPAEMKTMTYKGTLVDLACAGGSQTSSTATAGQPDTTSGASAAAGQTGSSASSGANMANRSAGDTSCPVTANSTQLGLKMDSGQTVRFDLVGNQRAQDELKNNKRWSKDISANKPLHVTISGVMQGQKLIVSSIH